MVLWSIKQVLMFSGDVCISGYRTYEVFQYVNSSDTLNTIFEYCHDSVNLDNVDVLYLEDGYLHVHRTVLKIKCKLCFFSKKMCNSRNK